MILSLLCGVALFLYGMTLMGDGLKKVAGNKLELILYKLTNTPIKGVLLGTIVTAIIQSSSATSVMVVGFVNSGMMKVIQGIGIIMGANIGTSITGWILCLSYIDGSSGVAQILSTATISAIVAIIGIIFKMFCKKNVIRNVGDIMLGFAILMVGMQNMSGAVAPLKESEEFTSMFTKFANPFLGILIGIAFTAILQSASAAVGILQALSITGGISFASAFPIIMGIGIGAACPVLLSSIGTNKNAKRTALVYLLNDLFGMIIWATVFYTLNAFVHFDFLEMTMTPVSIALINSVFRIATTVALLPFIKQIEKLVFFFIKDTEEDTADSKDFDLLEDRFIAFPDVAISQSHTAMNGMITKASGNILRALKLFTDFSEEEYNAVQEKEELIDKYEDKLGTYLMQLTGKEMNTAQTKQVSKMLHTLSDVERLGDHAVNIAKVANELFEKKKTFSEDAQAELSVLEDAIREILSITCQAFENDDVQLAKTVEPLSELIGILSDELKLRHIERLQQGKCDIKKGFAFNDLINNLERVGDHCSNVAVAIVELEEKNLDTHQYLNTVRNMNNEEYKACFDAYVSKYDIDGCVVKEAQAQA